MQIPEAEWQSLKKRIGTIEKVLKIDENEITENTEMFSCGEQGKLQSQNDFLKKKFIQIQGLIESGQANIAGCQGVILARIERKRREQKYYAITIILLQMIIPLLIALVMR